MVGGAPRHDFGLPNGGAAYLFSLASEIWRLRTALDGGGRCCDFGRALALDGDTLAVGAPRGTRGGSVVLFQRNEGGTSNWGELRRIMLATQTPVSLALDGDTLWVGEPLSRQADAPFGSGQVEVFRRNHQDFNDWGRSGTLNLSNFGRTPRDNDNFGRAVALDGGVGLATAAEEPSNGLPRENQGAGYVQGARLVPTVAAPGFGGAAALDGDTAVIGAAASFVNGRLQPGAASVFRRNQGGDNAWGEVRQLDLPEGSGNFGRALSLNGD